jgi:undecaprenyl-diphosphatase
MPATLQAAILGVVQGATEFLPVSSSAHLILARAFFGFDADKFGLAFDVACHVGTLIAVLVYFRRELMDLVAAVPQALLVFRGVRLQPDLRGDGPPRGGRHVQMEDARMIWLLALGTLPAVAAGLLFKHDIEESFRTPAVVAVMLVLGSIVFFIAERRGAKTRSDRSLTMTEAVWIGCAQAVALIPGVSRSGITISLALLLGLRRPDAARFIFLLAVPAILGAAGSEAPHLLKAGLAAETGILFAIGVAVSALVGYATIRFFMRFLTTRSLDVFAWYRIALAVVTFVWIARR